MVEFANMGKGEYDEGRRREIRREIVRDRAMRVFLGGVEVTLGLASTVAAIPVTLAPGIQVGGLALGVVGMSITALGLKNMVEAVVN